MTDSLESPTPFDPPYLLVTNIPFFVESDGTIFMDRLWHRDFVAHLEYVSKLTCAAPLVPKPPDRENLVRLDPNVFERSRIVALPPQRAVSSALVALPITFSRIWRAVGRAQVVHAGVGGWPYPLGWPAALCAKLRRRKLFVVVESAPWRTSGLGRRPRLIDRIRSAAYEAGARLCCRSATLCLYTQPYYQDSFPTGKHGAAVVAPATWIDDENMLDDAAVDASWNNKLRGHARFLFAGRITAEKGVRVLIEAMRRIDERGLDVHVDAIGTGDLTPALSEAATGLRTAKLRVLDPVPYGREFFALVDRYHALLVPSLSDEQPRVFFDAAARGVPVIASDTDGLRSLVRHDETGRLIPRGDAAALAAELVEWTGDASAMRSLGKAAVREVRTKTHRAMHSQRSRILAAHLGADAPDSGSPHPR